MPVLSLLKKWILIFFCSTLDTTNKSVRDIFVNITSWTEISVAFTKLIVILPNINRCLPGLKELSVHTLLRSSDGLRDIRSQAIPTVVKYVVSGFSIDATEALFSLFNLEKLYVLDEDSV